MKAFKDALAHQSKAKIVHEEYLPQTTTDFTAGGAAPVRRAEGQAGPQDHLHHLGRRRNPFAKIADLKPERYGIELATGGNILPAMASYKHFPGMEGATYYYFGFPKNPMNDWLVAEHKKRFNAPPDFFTAGGMAAAWPWSTAIKKAGGTDTEKLIAAMEGMSSTRPRAR